MESVAALSQLIGISPVWIALVILWILVWKGFALWRAAHLQQKYWFIVILIVNTLGILEIIYLFFVARKYKVEIIEQNE
ncbi:MAG: hypothetical protein HYT69_01095 [Candidatus Zambryskibacteria bacterium]|nr:hypothetical protein [Candidatus Zambryskibacteria bacterium]